MIKRLLLLAGLWASPVLAEPPEASAGAAAAPALYFDRVLTEADLQGRSLRELSIMRNTIFARAGNPFRKDWLDAYFRAQPWYQPQKTWDKTKISAVDWENAKIIATYETGLKAGKLVEQAAALKARVESGSATAEDSVELRLLSVRLGKWQDQGATPIANRSPLEDPSMLANQLTREQLSNMSRRDLRILRNTIYARHGYTFKSALLTQYFQGFDWYTADPAYTTARLSRVDWRNTKLIKTLEGELGGPLTDSEHMEEDGWFVAA